jgi:hypothetical protein
MAVVEPPQIAQSALPAGVGQQYARRWIAVRNGVVIAAADDMTALAADERVGDDDTVYHVPPPNSAFF